MLVENRGQAPAGVRFVLRDRQLNAFFRDDAIQFRDGTKSVTMRFQGRNPSAKIVVGDPVPGRVNLLRGGNADAWIQDAQLYPGLTYLDLYPGIDLVWLTHDNVLKSEFVVAPGVDVRAVKLAYSGAMDIRIEDSGCLLLRTGAGVIREDPPVAYTTRDGSRTPVRARFRLDAGYVGFDVGRYDHTATLVIDPVLSYSTFLGGSGHDAATSIATGSDGSVYIAGWTESFDFPVTGGLTRASGVDGFVAKFNSANTLVYCTYFGGSSEDRISGVAIDDSGNATIVGYTSSPDIPILSAMQTTLRGTRNVFLAKLNPAGSGLVYSTYLGGSGVDVAAGIALDNSGSIYVGGYTSSANFPTINALQRSQSGTQNGFVFKVNASGNSLMYSTYLGGSSVDAITGIAVDSSGSAYVTGNTQSANFPTANAYRASIPGKESPFVAKLSPDGMSLVYSTFLGGSGGAMPSPEIGNAIAVDATGAAYVTGVTSSIDFPLVNPYQVLTDAGTHGFVAKLTPSGNALVYSTYLGGSARDWPNAIAVGSSGSVYVGGYTSSMDFPALNPIQSSLGGVYDAFLARLDANGVLLFSTFLGGSSIDSADAIAYDAAAHVILAGHTMSTDFPLVASFQVLNADKYAAFLAKITDNSIPASPSITKTHGGAFLQGQQNASYTINVSNGSGVGPTSGTVTVTETVPAGMTLVSMSGSGWTCPGTLSNNCTRGDTLDAGGSYSPITVTVKVLTSATSPQANQASVSGGGSATAIVTDSTIILSPPVLSISKTHAGNFTQGQQNAAYTLTVSNLASTSPTSGTVTVTETVPSGLTLVSMSGSGWTCPGTLSNSCTRSDILISGSSYSPIAVTVSVAQNAPSQVSNQASVSGGGSVPANASDTTTIAPSGNGLRFVPIPPCRIADTRVTPNGPFSGPPLAAKTARDFVIPNSACGIPSTAAAYSLNVTVIPPAMLGFLTVWPSGQSMPVSSTLNSMDGRTKANAAMVAAGTGGAVSFYANAITDLVVDIDGYFLPAGVSQSALAFYPLTPCRIADTRNANLGQLGSPSLVAKQSRTFPVRLSSCNIPASAQAYSLNFTAIPSESLGFLTAWSTGQARPLASVLNDLTGTTVANAAIIPAGTNGSVDVYANAGTDLIIDINGYFALPDIGALSLYTMTPCRVIDTRVPAGSQPFKGELDVSVSTNVCGLPATAQAYVFNATVVPPSTLGFLTLWPQGTTRPIVSTLNALDGQITSNLAIVPVSDGGVAAYANAFTQLILDIFGYFAP